MKVNFMDSITFEDSLQQNKELYVIVSNYKDISLNNLIIDTSIYKYCINNIQDIYTHKNFTIYVYKNSRRVQLDLKLSPRKFGRNSGNYDDIFEYWFYEGKMMDKRIIKNGKIINSNSEIQILR